LAEPEGQGLPQDPAGDVTEAPEPSAQVPGVEAETPGTPEEAPTDYAKILDEAPDEVISSHPRVTKRVNDRFQSERDKQRSAEQKRLEEVTQAQAVMQRYANTDGATPEVHQQRVAAYLLQNPDAMDAYSKAQRTLQSPQVNPESAVQGAFERMQGELKENETFAHISDDEWAGHLEGATDFADFAVRVIGSAYDQRKKTMDAEMKAEMAAMEKRLAAKYNLTADQPEQPPGAAVGNDAGRLTREDIGNMTPEEVAKNEDAIFSQLGAK
jgi:hypothetical protein